MAPYIAMKFPNSVGNISGVEFKDAWPTGRPFKHGALEIRFVFPAGTKISAEEDVEALMEEHGYIRGKDYNIPGWNYSLYYGQDHDIAKLVITFDNDETFVMAKMSWDLDTETETDG